MLHVQLLTSTLLAVQAVECFVLCSTNSDRQYKQW